MQVYVNTKSFATSFWKDSEVMGPLAVVFLLISRRRLRSVKWRLNWIPVMWSMFCNAGAVKPVCRERGASSEGRLRKKYAARFSMSMFEVIDHRHQTRTRPLENVCQWHSATLLCTDNKKRHFHLKWPFYIQLYSNKDHRTGGRK